MGEHLKVHRRLDCDAIGNRLRDSLRGKGRFLANFLEGDGLSKFLADEDGFGRVAAEQTGQMVKRFSYRPDGKLSQFQSGDASATYHYDALGRLVAVVALKNGVESKESFVHLAEENRFLLSKSAGGKITVQIDGQGVAERLGEVSANGGHGYITDHQGSVLNSPLTAGTNSYGLSGEVVASENGNAASPVNYGWQGLRFDSLIGNYDNNARVYNQNAGVFTSQDPLGVASGDINFYGSRRNNPLSYTDPDGRCPLCVVVGIGAGIGAAGNLLGSYLAGTLNSQNFIQTGLIGATAGAAAVLTSGALGAAATATTVAELVAVDVGATGILSALGATAVDIGLNVLFNPPPEGVSAKDLAKALKPPKAAACD